MMLGFRHRFERMILEGSKTHTIRGKRSISPRVGETIHCYVNPRQKSMRLLGRWACVKVQDIRIELPQNDFLTIYLDGERLSFDEASLLAFRDGFREHGISKALFEFERFWRIAHRLRPGQSWRGDLIHWDFQKRMPAPVKRSKPADRPRCGDWSETYVD